MNLNRRQFLGLLGVLGAQRVTLAQNSPFTLLRLPYLQRTRSDRVALMWATLEQGEGKVQYSANALSSSIAPARSRTFYPEETGLPYSYVQYESELSRLQPKTLYDYRVSTNGQTIQEAQFTTAGPGPFDFMVFGDSGQQLHGQVDLASRIVLERPSFLLHTGDIAYNEGTFAQFQTSYFDYYRDIMSYVPFFPTPGNHDYGTAEAAPYIAVHGVPRQSVPTADRGRYYSFDWGNAHFISLNSNTPLEQAVEQNGQMLQWLERDLNSTRQFWRIAFFHHPPYAVGPNETHILSALVREHVVPILETHGVQLVFSGHEHSYQRTHSIRNNAITSPDEGTVYITSGGGGGDLYPVYEHPMVNLARSEFHYLRVDVGGTELRLRAINADGFVIDTHTLAPHPIIEPFKRIPAVGFNSGLVPGAIVRIMGRNLAAHERYVSGSELPTELAGTVVTLNDRAIQLIYTSSNQIYGWIPFDLEGSVTLRVTTGNGSAEISV